MLQFSIKDVLSDVMVYIVGVLFVDAAMSSLHAANLIMF